MFGLFNWFSITHYDSFVLKTFCHRLLMYFSCLDKKLISISSVYFHTLKMGQTMLPYTVLAFVVGNITQLIFLLFLTCIPFVIFLVPLLSPTGMNIFPGVKCISSCNTLLLVTIHSYAVSWFWYWGCIWRCIWYSHPVKKKLALGIYLNTMKCCCSLYHSNIYFLTNDWFSVVLTCIKNTNLFYLSLFAMSIHFFKFVSSSGIDYSWSIKSLCVLFSNNKG